MNYNPYGTSHGVGSTLIMPTCFEGTTYYSMQQEGIYPATSSWFTTDIPVDSTPVDAFTHTLDPAVCQGKNFMDACGC